MEPNIKTSLENTESEDEQEDNELVGKDACEIAGPSWLTTKRRLVEDDFSYKVMTFTEIVSYIEDYVREVNDILQLSTDNTRILLGYCKWDKEKLMECYYGSDQEKLFADAHLLYPYNKSVTYADQSSVAFGLIQPLSKSSSTMQTPSAECKICLLSCSSAAMTGLACGHEFCSSCWENYLTRKILDGVGENLSCAAFGCDVFVGENSVMKFVGDPVVKLKYQQLMTNSFIVSNPLFCWCPSPDCSHIIKVTCYDAKRVTCFCGNTFCFVCGERWHDPVQCKWLKKWLERCDSDSNTSNWISANTRECPNCHATIEKDGGCKRMVCTRCSIHFCWVCLKPWDLHRSSKKACIRFEEEEKEEKKAQEEAQEKSHAELQRYSFYYNRYMSHMQSLKSEHNLYFSITSEMEKKEYFLSWYADQILHQAVDVLCRSRETLMFTYVFAFYLKSNSQSVLFEDNQYNLEIAQDQLSEYLEQNISSEVHEDVPQRLHDIMRYCESRRQALIDHVHDGYGKDFWEYREI